MRTRALAIGAPLLAVIVLGVVLPRLNRRVAPAPAAVAPQKTPEPSGRKIKARLFYVAADGAHLTSAERDVAYADTPADQAREIIQAQITPVPDPIVSAIPPGTTLRAVFIADGGTAYVDLSADVSTAHAGGTVDELLTIYAIVDALTVNLPAITTVQILVDGKEVETLAGHVDLRRPLARNLSLVQ